MANNPKDLYLPPNIVKTKKGNVTAVTGSTTPSFSLKSWLDENNFQPSPQRTGEKVKFYNDDPIALLATEQVLESFKINANTYKVGETGTLGQSIFVYTAISSDLTGWSDLSNVLTRDYDNFYQANVGRVGENVVGTEFVMRETSSGRYWRIKFSSWTQGNGGGFSYERTEIDPNTGQDLGATVTFTKDDNVPNTDVIIPGVLEITRDNQQAIYNSALEAEYDRNTRVSPLNTEWNSIFTSPIDPYKLKCYWSYSRNGKDNLIKEYETDEITLSYLFSLVADFDRDPGLSLLNKIETPTTLRKLDNTSFTDMTIPNVERDVYLTVTCEGNPDLKIKLIYLSQVSSLNDIGFIK